MMVVPNSSHEASVLRKVDELAREYVVKMVECQDSVQQALNLLIDVGFDPTSAVHIINTKFRIHPPKNVGVEEHRNEPDVSIHIPDFPESLRPNPDTYEED